MILDYLLQLASDQDLDPLDDSAVVSEYVIDRETANNDIIAGEPMYLIMSTSEDLAGGTSITVDFRSDSAVGLATTPTIHCSRTFTIASIASGTHVVGKIDGPISERYCGAFITAVGTMTGGIIDLFLVKDVPNELR